MSYLRDVSIYVPVYLHVYPAVYWHIVYIVYRVGSL